MQKILIVDDDTSFGMMVKGYLKKNDLEATLSGSLSNAKAIFGKEHFDMVLTDYRLPDGTGLDILRHVKKSRSSMPVVLITAYSDIRVAVNAIKDGAFEYITKPVNAQELLHVVNTAVRSGKTGFNPGSDYIRGEGEESRLIEDHIKLVAPTEISVLIQGESGTGKEFVARRIHELSHHSSEPFLAVDCGALTSEIASSELFGHEKGSFTGAMDEKKGYFESVGKGTIFLDEVGNLSYDVQVKLLRAIQERRAHRVGSNREFKIEARIVAASNDHLRKRAMEGDFREDLYHRLNEFTVFVLPLRERHEELMMFAGHFKKLAAKEFDKNILGFSDEVLEVFKRYEWPGNLRELRNVVRRSVLLCQNKFIALSVIPGEIVESRESPSHGLSFSEAKNETEKNLIIDTLFKVKHNKSKAADLLGIDRKTLYNKLQKYNIEY
jgi:two-component system response regulator HydG